MIFIIMTLLVSAAAWAFPCLTSECPLPPPNEIISNNNDLPTGPKADTQEKTH